MKKINVLGTEYTIEQLSKNDDDYLSKCDGYCDKTTHRIVVKTGLAENFEHQNQFGHEETMVDWFAIQFPKILKAFKESDCI